MDMVPSCLTSKKILTKRAHLGNWTNGYPDISSTTSLHFTGVNLSPWPWNHGSGKWLYLKGNYCWRYTHLSLNKMIMGGKGYQSFTLLVIFSQNTQKKNTLKKKTKKNEFVSRCPMILAVSRCPGGIGIPFLFAIFCQKNTADRGT